jgi:hypothetical protein
MEDLQRMNVGVYSYWDRSAADSKYGVINWFESIAPENNWLEPFKRDVRFFKQDRVFGEFILLFDTPSGAILVSDDYQRVFLALGIRDSIGYVMGAREPFEQFSRLIGMPITTTLLPWQDMVVYDGLLHTPRVSVTKKGLKKALRAFMKAVDTGTLITALPRKPLPPQSGAKSPAAATASAAPGVNIADLKIRLQSKINTIASMRTYDSEKEGAWVFRRHGYTRAENPHFLVTVISSGGAAIYPYASFADLDPTVEEMIDLLLQCCNSARGRRPSVLLTDAEHVVAPLKEVSVALRCYDSICLQRENVNLRKVDFR